jgi:hypothetical protein
MDWPAHHVGLALSLVLSGLAVAPAQASFPGRNGAIAFVQNSASGEPAPIVETRALAAVLPGATQPRDLVECRLTDGVPSGGDCSVTRYSAPLYSPDGRRIVFDAGDRLAVIDADGSDLTLLPATTAGDGDPVFAPDGERIAFTGVNDRGTTDLYVRRLDGGPARVVVYDASAPAWSSRNRLAYVREGNVYTADPNGRRRRFVSSGVSPDWSPNGRRLALVRPSPNLTFAGDTGRLYIVRANGRGPRRVGSRADLSHPVWSPDGRWLAYDGFELGVHKRRLVGRPRVRQVAPTQIGSEGAFIASYGPTWQPR